MRDKFQVIDDKLEKLQEQGLMEHISTRHNGLPNWAKIEYWAKFVSFLSKEEIDLILSVEQQGNWNSILYDAALATRGILRIKN